jgi:hypothetical protein
MAQQTQAATISGAPGDSVAPAGCQESKAPPATIATMPKTICLSAFSLKTIQARSAVNTPSMFRSSDAEDKW